MRNLLMSDIRLLLNIANGQKNIQSYDQLNKLSDLGFIEVTCANEIDLTYKAAEYLTTEYPDRVKTLPLL